MGKQITIPTWRNPYIVEINGKKYSYKAGEMVEVPDEVAEVIEHEKDMAPVTPTEVDKDTEAFKQPEWGKGIGLVPASKSSEWRELDDGSTLNFAEMTKEEYESITCATSYGGVEEIPLESLYYDADLGGVCFVETEFTVEYMTKGEVTKKIPTEYVETTHEVMWVSFRQVTEDVQSYLCDKTVKQIEEAIKDGTLIVIREYGYYDDLLSVSVDVVYSSEDSYSGYQLYVGKFVYDYEGIDGEEYWKIR